MIFHKRKQKKIELVARPGKYSRFIKYLLLFFQFFAMVERGYHSTNPYHNNVHAADVTQAMACFLSEPLLRKHLTPLEVMASLVAAVCHDVDHPGFNEKFLIARCVGKQ